MLNLGALLLYILALVAGLLAGFFLVFNSVFSDVSDQGERVFSFALVIIAYAVLGIIFGYFAASWTVSLALAAPAVLLVVWYTLREPGNLLLHLTYIAATLAAACAGAYIGARLRNRRGGQTAARSDTP